MCLQELWALIMDAGTAYTAQTYNLTSQFLPKEWIMEKWEEGFYITAMAGSNSGWSLVAMSKGTAYTQQSYKVGRCFLLGVFAYQKHIRVRAAVIIELSSIAIYAARACCRAYRLDSMAVSDMRLYLPLAAHSLVSSNIVCMALPCLAGVRLLPLQMDQQEVEGGLPCDQHGHKPHALGGRHEPQRRLRRAVCRARLPVPERRHPPALGQRIPHHQLRKHARSGALHHLLAIPCYISRCRRCGLLKSLAALRTAEGTMFMAAVSC